MHTAIPPHHRRTSHRIALSLVLLISLATNACEDDTTDSSAPRHLGAHTLSFSVDTTPAVLRSEGDTDEAECDTIIGLRGGDSPLYLHVEHSVNTTPMGEPAQSDLRLASAVNNNKRLASAVESNNDFYKTYNSISVTAFAYHERGGKVWEEWKKTLKPNYFHNRIARLRNPSARQPIYTLDTSDTYFNAQSPYEMRFYAVAPAEVESIEWSSADQVGDPSITVTVPTEAAQQYDLLVSERHLYDVSTISGSTGTARDVNLEFKHALTAIRFTRGKYFATTPVTIKTIRFKNVYSKGTFVLGDNNSHNSPGGITGWQNWGGQTTYTFSDLNITVDEDREYSEDDPVTKSGKYFFMLPQDLPKGASIEMDCEQDGKTYTLSANIGGTQWPKGYVVTYRLSSNSFGEVFIVPYRIEVPHTGGIREVTIKSYKKNAPGPGTTPIKWEVLKYVYDFIDHGKNPPEWLRDFDHKVRYNNQTELSTNIVIQSSFGRRFLTEKNPQDAQKLQSAQQKGGYNIQKRCNLSNQNTRQMLSIETTANCYVVTAPGYYAFPLIYGNAIRLGKDNPSAYKSKSQRMRRGVPHLTNFVNHLGNEIVNPCINYNHRCKVTKAKVLWSDSKNLVTDVRVENGFYPSTPERSYFDGSWIVFTVDRSSIRTGNALIAALDDQNNILWSWHIWVTTDDHVQDDADAKSENSDAVYGRAHDAMITNQRINGRDRQLRYYKTKVPLGWTNGSYINYPEQECEVTIRNDLGKEKVIHIRQKAGTKAGETSDGAVFYQWGRKDPLIASDGLNTHPATRPWFDEYGIEHHDDPVPMNLGTEKNFITNSILHPTQMHNGATTVPYCNVWDSTNDKNDGSPKSWGWFGQGEVFVHKTIYDPCPVGYQVPLFGLFSGHTQRGRSGEGKLGLYTKGTWEKLNDSWGTYLSFLGEIAFNRFIFYPAMGRRSYSDGKMQLVHQSGFFWSSAPKSGNGGVMSISAGSNTSDFNHTPILKLNEGVASGYGCMVYPCISSYPPKHSYTDNEW